jgi:preprotein translocase subunit SecD
VLSVGLSTDQVAALEAFTRERVGKRAAIVLGEEIVSIHKVLEVIDGGTMQITRCTDDACRRILSKLKAPAPSERR